MSAQSEPLSGQTLVEMKVRAAAATSGPWQAMASPGRGDFNIHSPEQDYLATVLRTTDALFIAAARLDMPRLLGEIERLWRELAEQRGEYELLLDDEKRRTYEMLSYQTDQRERVENMAMMSVLRVAQVRELALRYNERGEYIAPEELLAILGMGDD